MSSSDSTSGDLMVYVIVAEPERLEQIAELIRAGSYSVTAFSDVFSGLEAIKSAPPSAIVCDGDLPDNQAGTFLAVCNSHPDLRAVPLVLLNAYPENQGHVKFEEFHVEEVVSEPFDENGLMEVLKRITAPDFVPGYVAMDIDYKPMNEQETVPDPMTPPTTLPPLPSAPPVPPLPNVPPAPPLPNVPPAPPLPSAPPAPPLPNVPPAPVVRKPSSAVPVPPPLPTWIEEHGASAPPPAIAGQVRAGAVPPPPPPPPPPIPTPQRDAELLLPPVESILYKRLSGRPIGDVLDDLEMSGWLYLGEESGLSPDTPSYLYQRGDNMLQIYVNDQYVITLLSFN